MRVPIRHRDAIKCSKFLLHNGFHEFSRCNCSFEDELFEGGIFRTQSIVGRMHEAPVRFDWTPGELS